MNRFFTLLFAASCLTAVGQDFDGLTQAFATDNSIFLTSEGQLSWDSAQAFASSIGGHLATFNDAAENLEVVSWPSQNGGYWFGLRQDVNGAEPDEGWGWVTGESLDFTNWNDPEPNNIGGNEECGELTSNGTWNDGACAELRFFVVEIALHAGCTDQMACNYDADANLDDGSCHFNCQFCHDGTVWDEDLFKCVVANPSDSNFDGCVQLNDLLDLLSAYGDCGAEESLWQCGDPLEYQGYDYETVQIGEQCWFSENCRHLPEVSPSSEGSETAPYYYVYGYEGSTVAEAKATDSFEAFGVLYNWPAVMTEGICPTGWHTPSDEDWQTMEISLGMNESEAALIGWRGSPFGEDIKSSSGWNGGGNGSNSSGFNGLPVGARYNGDFDYNGGIGFWWSSSASSSDSWRRELYYNRSSVYRNYDNLNLAYGYSARCVRDAE